MHLHWCPMSDILTKSLWRYFYLIQLSAYQIKTNIHIMYKSQLVILKILGHNMIVNKPSYFIFFVGQAQVFHLTLEESNFILLHVDGTRGTKVI